MKAELIKVGKRIAFTVGKYMPKALTGMSAGLTAGGIFLAVKAGIEFQKLRDSGDEITWQDYVRIFGPCVMAGVFSIACAFAGLSKMEQRYAAAALLANGYEIAQKELEEKGIELFGENKMTKLHDETNKERLNKVHFSEAEMMMAVNGQVWFVDEFSNQKTLSSMEKIDAAVNQLNYQITHGGEISYPEYSDRLDFPEDPATWEYSWRLESTGLIELRKTWTSLDGRTPVCILEHKNKPKLKYELDEDSENKSRLPGWGEV